MRGKYYMMDWELEKWKQKLSAVIARLTWDKQHQEDFTQLDICPINIEKTLENLGWELECYEREGCDPDAWYFFKHPDYEFELILLTDSDTFEMKLFRHE